MPALLNKVVTLRTRYVISKLEFWLNQNCKTAIGNLNAESKIQFAQGGNDANNLPK